jgi:hypothetical protein
MEVCEDTNLGVNNYNNFKTGKSRATVEVKILAFNPDGVTLL